MKSGDEPICVEGYAFMATPGKPPRKGLSFYFHPHENALMVHQWRHFPRDKPLKRKNTNRSYSRMNPGLTRLFLLGALGFLPACATTSSGPVVITKVNPHHLTNGLPVRTQDEMIRFEQQRLLYGAIENEERQDRFGNYFTIFWKTKTRNPATVRLEYRQGSTGFATHVQEVQVDNPKSDNTTKFEVTGDDYQKNGKVTQWKASIVENGSVVAEYQSYLWQ